MYIFWLLLLIRNTFGFNLAIVGASGGLGRELVYQATNDRNLTVLGLTSKPSLISLCSPSVKRSWRPRPSHLSSKNSRKSCLAIINPCSGRYPPVYRSAAAATDRL